MGEKGRVEGGKEEWVREGERREVNGGNKG